MKKMGTLRIQATPIVKGKYAQEILAEISRKPSQRAIKRNMKAKALVEKLRK